MKLRIHQNSVRLRLGQSEVNDLAAGRAIEAKVDLLPEPLLYRVEGVAAADVPSVGFSHGELRVTLPLGKVQLWARSDQVSIESDVSGTPGAVPIRVLVEKDFRCLHGAAGAADQADCFPNPRPGSHDAGIEQDR